MIDSHNYKRIAEDDVHVWLGLLYGASAEQLTEIARAAEQLGFHGAALPDHVAVPVDFTTPGPPGHDEFKVYIGAEGEWLDPLPAIAAMGAVTDRLRFLTFAYILPCRHPVIVAKSVATTAMLTNYRLDFGAAVGWLEEEGRLLGARWEHRGRQMDEMLAILEDFWDDGYAEFHGEFYDFPRTAMFPVPTQKIKIFLGGASDAALRRAARFDGFLPMDPGPAVELAHRVLSLRERGAGDDPFEVMVVRSWFGDRPLDCDELDALDASGITSVLLNVWPYFDERYADLGAKLDVMEAAASTLRLRATTVPSGG
jgi:probable F420-dependent oxidoreductase